MVAGRFAAWGPSRTGRNRYGKLRPSGKLKCCYEAGPTGYVLYWQLTQMGVACEVIAPSLIPTKAGDRVKTDRPDAERLARCYRAGELTALWVPDEKHEALRDLVRAREAAKQDQLRHRHQLGKFLLRHGKRPTDAGKAWSAKYLNWIKVHVRFEQPALEATLADYLHEVEHVAERIIRLEHRCSSMGMGYTPAANRLQVYWIRPLGDFPLETLGGLCYPSDWCASASMPLGACGNPAGYAHQDSIEFSRH